MLYACLCTPQHRRSEKVPANETHAQAEFDPNNPFFTVDYTARDEEEELMISLDGEDEFTVSEGA